MQCAFGFWKVKSIFINLVAIVEKNSMTAYVKHNMWGARILIDL